MVSSLSFHLLLAQGAGIHRKTSTSPLLSCYKLCSPFVIHTAGICIKQHFQEFSSPGVIPTSWSCSQTLHIRRAHSGVLRCTKDPRVHQGLAHFPHHSEEPPLHVPLVPGGWGKGWVIMSPLLQGLVGTLLFSSLSSSSKRRIYSYIIQLPSSWGAFQISDHLQGPCNFSLTGSLSHLGCFLPLWHSRDRLFDFGHLSQP